MITGVSAIAFAALFMGAWAWVGHQRRNSHAKKRDR